MTPAVAATLVPGNDNVLPFPVTWRDVICQGNSTPAPVYHCVANCGTPVAGPLQLCLTCAAQEAIRG